MKINVHIFLLLILACIAAINDAIIYIFNMQYNIALFLSAIFVACIFFVLVKKIKLFEVKSDFDKGDLFFIIPFLALAVYVLLAFDTNFDCTNYHYYLQKDPFRDKLHFDFLPGKSYNSFLFPLGDRMFYIFRNIFGIRFGRLLSAYTLIVVFYQTKRILLEQYNLPKKKLIILSAGVAVIGPCLEKVFTYYIDNFSCVFLYELIHIFLLEKNIYKEKKYLYIFVLFSGIAAAIKIPNIFLAFTIFLAITINNSIVDKKFKLIENLKNIKIYDYLFLILILFCPFMIYMIDNYIQTGSVLYPYYNTVFKSPYFSNINWIDKRFGMLSPLSTFVFPIIIAFNPNFGNNGVCGVGIYYIAYIICILNLIWSKKKDLGWKLSLLTLVLIVIWLNFMMAYTRYAIIIAVLLVLIEYDIFLKSNIKEKIESLLNAEKQTMGMIISLFVSFSVIAGIGINYVESFGYINRIVFDYGRCINFKYYETARKDEKVHIDGVWISLYDIGGLTDLIREENTPIYNLDKEHYQNSEKLLDMFDQIIKEHGDELYMLVSKQKGYRAFEKMWANNFMIEKIMFEYKNPYYQNREDVFYICKMKYLGDTP